MRQILITFFSFIILTTPVLVTAAGLVPCGAIGEPECDTGMFVVFINGLISFLISMLGVIAIIVLVYAGFRMVISAGNESEWTKAKSLFTNVIIGIVLILAAWLLVDTVMKALTGSGLTYWGNFGR